MANMDITQRTQLDRVDLSVQTTGTHVRDRRPLIAYTVFALAVLTALTYALVEVFDGWAHAVVLGGIVTATIGLIIAVDPLRRG
jgi:fatty acid desaturase